MSGENTYKESDGRAIYVDLTDDVLKGQVIYVDGWLGIAGDNGTSGDTITMIIDDAEYQFTVPAALTVNKGDVVYINTAQVTGHQPDEVSYATSPGAGLMPLFRATSAKDANNVVTGILLSKAVMYAS